MTTPDASCPDCAPSGGCGNGLGDVGATSWEPCPACGERASAGGVQAALGAAHAQAGPNAAAIATGQACPGCLPPPRCVLARLRGPYIPTAPPRAPMPAPSP